MRYNKIRKMDISNGKGIRVSIFMQGCTFNCKNCFNPETHDFKGGKEFTDETIEEVLKLCELEHIQGLSILGGEPMHPNNIEGTTKLVNVEGYTCTINSDNPVDISIGKYFASTQAKALYKEHRAECHEDYAMFENECYALQDQMIAEKNAATETVETAEETM